MRCLPLADDCGVSNTNTESIFECIDAGALHGTSILACGAALNTAINGLAKRLPLNANLRVGVHLNLLEGHCTANPASIPLLVDERGIFKNSLGKLCLTLLRASPRQKSELNEQAALEWQAQIELIKSKMRAASDKDVLFYLDGHQHVHAIPALREALNKILNQHQFTHVRVPEEARYYVPAPPMLQLAGNVRRELLAHWGKTLRAHLAKIDVPVPNYFIGAFASGAMNYQRLAAGLGKIAKIAQNNELVEIMFHPGGYSPQGLQKFNKPAKTHLGASSKNVFSAFYAAPERIVEKNLLLSKQYQQLLAQYNV